MNSDQLLAHIVEEGFFFYGSSKWCTETDVAIEELKSLDLIESLDVTKGNQDNNCYCYVEKDNPRNVDWIMEHGSYYKIGVPK